MSFGRRFAVLAGKARENAARNFNIVKRKFAIARDLDLLVALAGQHDNVSGARGANSNGDRASTVGLDDISSIDLIETGASFVNDGERVLGNGDCRT